MFKVNNKDIKASERRLHSLNPRPPFFKGGGGVNFSILPRRGESENF